VYKPSDVRVISSYALPFGADFFGSVIDDIVSYGDGGGTALTCFTLLTSTLLGISFLVEHP
jgi:hypothetical protein